MLSKQARFQYWLIRLVVKPLGGPWVALRIKRLLSSLWARFLPAPSAVELTSGDLGGVPCEWYRSSASQGRDKQLMLYFHGGAYVLGSAAAHRSFVQRFHQLAGLNTVSIDYRLAPEHPYPAAVDDAQCAWQALLKRGYQPGNIVLAGDSAGGGLALALIQRLRSRGQAMPAAVFALCPWLDLNCRHDSLRRLASRDAMLNPRTLRDAAAMYAGDTSLSHPEISPLYGDWDGVPPILVHAADRDVLYDEACEFGQRSNIHFKAWPGLWHVFHSNLHNVPEALEAAEEGFAFLNQQLRKAEGAEPEVSLSAELAGPAQ